ncbi:hypothetical protein D0C36_21695 [Mucilaginibacter conchicola]|uniref:Uncharacterized protein n=1 Tax=Mucilaginibacter conchicola TaxID=2303333 RepID=A0A372NNA1_9SPHI|nr:hypothetical protein D0C36_21695 [Mucilaginibacter conchicola]
MLFILFRTLPIAWYSAFYYPIINKYSPKCFLAKFLSKFSQKQNSNSTQTLIIFAMMSLTQLYLRELKKSESQSRIPSISETTLQDTQFLVKTSVDFDALPEIKVLNGRDRRREKRKKNN